MLTREDLIRMIASHKAAFETLNEQTATLSAEEVFDLYFYEEGDAASAIGFNPQTGEHLRVGEHLYYKPDVSHLVPEELRKAFLDSKIDT